MFGRSQARLKDGAAKSYNRRKANLRRFRKGGCCSTRRLSMEPGCLRGLRSRRMNFARRISVTSYLCRIRNGRFLDKAAATFYDRATRFLNVIVSCRPLVQRPLRGVS